MEKKNPEMSILEEIELFFVKIAEVLTRVDEGLGEILKLGVPRDRGDCKALKLLNDEKEILDKISNDWKKFIMEKDILSSACWNRAVCVSLASMEARSILNQGINQLEEYFSEKEKDMPSESEQKTA